MGLADDFEITESHELNGLELKEYVVISVFFPLGTISLVYIQQN